MADHIFITGGSRSGKSTIGETLAQQYAGNRVAYVATAETLDGEMQERIDIHRRRRPKEWDTHEEPLDIASLLVSLDKRYPVILVDCITMWVSNLMFHGKDVMAQVAALQQALSAMDSRVIMVSGEVGWGLIGDNALSRQFADHLGSINQSLAGSPETAK